MKPDGHATTVKACAEYEGSADILIPVFISDTILAPNSPAIVNVTPYGGELIEALLAIGLEMCIYERSHEEDVLTICFSCPGKDYYRQIAFSHAQQLIDIVPTVITQMVKSIAPFIMTKQGSVQ